MKAPSHRDGYPMQTSAKTVHLGKPVVALLEAPQGLGWAERDAFAN
jgi:hypothetical protein